MKKIIIVFFLLALSLSAFSCGGGSGSSETPSGENPGTPSITQLLPSHYIAHTNSDITLHARVLDGNGVPVRHVPVRFTNLSPVGVLSATSAKTNDIGIATVILHSHVEGFATVQAEVNKGVAIVRDKKTVFFATTLNLVPVMYLDVDGDNDGIYNETSDFILFETTTDNQVIIRATVFNRFGQRAAFTSVTFGADSSEASFPLGSIKTTDADGEAFVLVRVDPIEIRDIQTVLNITAVADNGAANMVTLFLQPVVISNITVYADPTTVESGGTSKITAFVTTTAGTPAPDGTTVTFTASKGGIDPFSQTTDGWTEEVTFTAPTVTATTTAIIRAKVADKEGQVIVEITGPPPLSVTPPSVPIGGATGGTATFTISGGKPAYTITSNNPAFPPVPASVATSGGTFTVTVPNGTAAATVVYTIQDTLGNTATATLQITAAAGAMTVAPLSATICENTNACSAGKTTQIFTITGGTPPYNVVSSSVPVIANQGPLPGPSPVTFTVDALVNSITADTTVTLTITDSAGTPATVTRTVTVINQT